MSESEDFKTGLPDPMGMSTNDPSPRPRLTQRVFTDDEMCHAAAAGVLAPSVLADMLTQSLARVASLEADLTRAREETTPSSWMRLYRKLEAQRDEAREALRPWAAWATNCGIGATDDPSEDETVNELYPVRTGDLRRAKEVLGEPHD